MKLRLWLKRIKGFKIRGLHSRSSKHFLSCKAMKAKPIFHITNSPVFVSGTLSLPSSHIHTPCLSPVLPHKALHHVNQNMFSLSPVSPSPSPALTSTPTGHNTPLALKDLLGFEAVDNNKKPPNRIACIAASLGCCKTESPRMDSSSNGAYIKRFASPREQNHLNTLKLHDDGRRLQASTTKWTGICKCMLVRVEKQIVKTHADVHNKPRGTHRLSTWDSHTMVKQNAIQNGRAKRANSMQASDSNVCIDMKDASSLSSSAIVCKKPTTSSLDRGKATAGKFSMDRDDKINPVKKPPLVCKSTSTRCTLRKGQLSLATKDEIVDKAGPNLFVDKAGPSAPSSVSSMDKLHKSGSHDAENADRGAPSVYKWTTHQEQADQSGQVVFNSIDQAVNGNKLSGLGSDEESSLLQADSYDSSETFSISSHSPWLNEPKQGTSSSSLVDLEAHARPWIATESYVSVAKLHCKSAFNHEKSRRGDTKALRRSYDNVFVQKAGSTSHPSKTDTIVLPSEIGNANQELNPSSVHARKTVNGGFKGSLAVEKRSRDPYVDFTDSMLDMILQNHMCSSKELEGLLQCFLSLNSLEHHDVIVQAFTEVWEKVVVGKTASSDM